MYKIYLMCSLKEQSIPLDRGVVKWYHRGLQNLWWEFDSLHLVIILYKLEDSFALGDNVKAFILIKYLMK